MENRVKRQWIVSALTCIGLGLAATANAVPVAYEISDDYRSGSFSASALHGATGCSNMDSTIPGVGSPLYMCGNPVHSITGIIQGNLIGGFLAITGGSLSINGSDYAIGRGAAPDYIGARRGPIMGAFGVEDHGYFFFERRLDMGAGRPNSFDGNTLILWGQNLAAYLCTPGQHSTCDFGPRWGIDLYGQRIAVPEPGTLALFGIGLLLMATMRRRIQKAVKA